MTAPIQRLAVASGVLALLLAHVASAQTAGTPHPATPIAAQAQPATSAPARAAQPRAETASAQVDATFAAWDTDHNNALSAQEFRNGWANLRNAMVVNRLHEQFTAVDANKSGAIDPAEFGNLYLIKHAGASAPAFASFDGNHDQKLDFAEYTALVQRLASQERTARPTPATK